MVGCVADLPEEHAPRHLPKRRVQDETAVSNRHFISVSGAPILTGQGKTAELRPMGTHLTLHMEVPQYPEPSAT